MFLSLFFQYFWLYWSSVPSKDCFKYLLVVVKPLEFPNWDVWSLGQPTFPRSHLKLLVSRQGEIKFFHINTSADSLLCQRMKYSKLHMLPVRNINCYCQKFIKMDGERTQEIMMLESSLLVCRTNKRENGSKNRNGNAPCSVWRFLLEIETSN